MKKSVQDQWSTLCWFIIFGLSIAKISAGLISCSDGFLWDLSVYSEAVFDYINNENPYKMDGDLLFVYHPIVLQAFSILGMNLAVGCAIFYLVSTAIFLNYFSKIPLENKRLYLFAAFSIDGVGFLAVVSGNITVFLHLLLLGIFLRYTIFPKKNMRLIYGFLMLSICIKPYFAIYFLLCVWLADNKRRACAYAALAGCVPLSIFIGYGLFFRDATQDFIGALLQQTLNNRDLGISFFAWIYNYITPSGTLALALHVGIFGIVSWLSCLVYASRDSSVPDNKKLELLLLGYFVLTLVNPRMKGYDFYPAIICLFTYAGMVCPKNIVLGVIAAAILVTTIYNNSDAVLCLSITMTFAVLCICTIGKKTLLMRKS